MSRGLRIAGILGGILIVGCGLLYGLAPRSAAFTQKDLPQDHVPDPERGQIIYNVAGCHTCHAAANGTSDLPVGGVGLTTPIGTFYPPNLTPDPETGLGNWSALQLANALMHGTAPNGAHLVPALPYTSYRNMRIEDVLDLHAYLKSLEPVRNAVPADDVPGLALARPLIGWWKWLALDDDTIKADAAQSAAWNRGAYLVVGPGHCGECHTPRNFLMIADESRFLDGGPHPEGTGRVPSLRGLIERGDYASVTDLADALEYGEMFGYDGLSSGGMGAVQANLAKLPREDIEAIATYLTSLKPLSDGSQ